MALNPSLIVADEPVSALDVSIQAQILNLLQDLQEKYGLPYLLITHDLGVVEHTCSRIAVMYVGKLVEMGNTKEIFAKPAHPYTEALLSAVPRPNPHYPLEPKLFQGEVADPANRPTGCAFHPRCEYALPICQKEEPLLGGFKGDNSRLVACHRAEELDLVGVRATSSKAV